MADRTATSVLFGFDFQTNAAIILMLENIKDIQGSIYYFSKYKKVKGVYLDDGIIYSNINGNEEKIVGTCEIINNITFLDNVLAAILIGEVLKIDREKIIRSIIKAPKGAFNFI